jgi:lysozyme family protein
MNFEQAFDRLIGHEGGYVNDARDPGGETKFGISKRAYPTLDIKNITVEDAKRIYRRDYWERAKCDLYDAAVNSGYDNASRFLQRAVGVADDGKIGPVTVAAINEMLVTDVLARFNAERLLFYTKLSTWPTYGKGWARRIAQNLLYSSEDA